MNPKEFPRKRKKKKEFIPPRITYVFLGAQNIGPFEFHIEGSCRINARYISRRFALSKEYESFQNVIANHLNLKDILISSGEWSCSIFVYHPRKHIEIHGENGCKIAQIDVDAVTKAALDALEKGGIVDNDARIVKLVQEKIYDPKNGRRTHIRLSRLPPKNIPPYEAPPYESS